MNLGIAMEGELNGFQGQLICRNCQDKGGDHKLLVVPQDPELFEQNDLVVVISAANFKELTNDLKKLIKFLESAKECVEE